MQFFFFTVFILLLVKVPKFVYTWLWTMLLDVPSSTEVELEGSGILVSECCGYKHKSKKVS